MNSIVLSVIFVSLMSMNSGLFEDVGKHSGKVLVMKSFFFKFKDFSYFSYKSFISLFGSASKAIKGMSMLSCFSLMKPLIGL